MASRLDGVASSVTARARTCAPRGRGVGLRGPRVAFAFNGARMRAREEAAQGIGPLLATSRGVGQSPT